MPGWSLFPSRHSKIIMRAHDLSNFFMGKTPIVYFFYRITSKFFTVWHFPTFTTVNNCPTAYLQAYNKGWHTGYYYLN